MERLLTTREAAEMLSVSEAFLERDRWAGATIPFIRIGSRAVRYEVRAIKHYMVSRTCTAGDKGGHNGQMQEHHQA